MPTGRMALERRKPVLPLSDTGGDAKKMYLQMLENWNGLEWLGLDMKQFNRIARPGLSGADAAIELLDNLLIR